MMHSSALDLNGACFLSDFYVLFCLKMWQMNGQTSSLFSHYLASQRHNNVKITQFRCDSGGFDVIVLSLDGEKEVGFFL